MWLRFGFISLVVVCLSGPSAASNSTSLITKLFEQCTTKSDMLKCLKIQALKIADRALNSKSLNLLDGVTLVSSDQRAGKSLNGHSNLNETKLEQLDNQQIDGLLSSTASRFLQTHKLEVNVPRLVEEGRRRRRKGWRFGALYWALAIKGSFLAMAYNGIAIMAGAALIVGKMALLLSAILGLKKLVNSGHESTTFEIIKQPKYTESHTHSTSYEEESGPYHRSYDFDGGHAAEKRIYRAFIPTL